MLVIWYNADLKKYKFGNALEYTEEVETSTDPRSFSVLMELEGSSRSLAGKVIRQLNVLENKLARLIA